MFLCLYCFLILEAIAGQTFVPTYQISISNRIVRQIMLSTLFTILRPRISVLISELFHVLLSQNQWCTWLSIFDADFL